MTARRRYDDIARQVGGRRVPGLFGKQGSFGGFDVVYDYVGGGPPLTDAAKRIGCAAGAKERPAELAGLVEYCVQLSSYAPERGNPTGH